MGDGSVFFQNESSMLSLAAASAFFRKAVLTVVRAQAAAGRADQPQLLPELRQ
jgi:hypothetical protein